jgi:flagellar protein FlaG
MTIDAVSVNTVSTLKVARGAPEPATGGHEATVAAEPAPRDSRPSRTTDLAVLKEQLAVINQQLREQQSNLAFSVDETTGRTIVRVFRESTGELVRQIPSEEVIAIAASLQNGEPLTSLGLQQRT